jgi:hypothetical protein
MIECNREVNGDGATPIKKGTTSTIYMQRMTPERGKGWPSMAQEIQQSEHQQQPRKSLERGIGISVFCKWAFGWSEDEDKA